MNLENRKLWVLGTRQMPGGIYEEKKACKLHQAIKFSFVIRVQQDTNKYIKNYN